jgi:hypothetical protein
MNIIKSSLLIIVLMISNCASLQPTGNAFTKVDTFEKEKGLVYIYRPWLFSGGGIFYEVKNNDQTLVELSNGTYRPVFVKPGENTFTAKTVGSASITIDIKEGESYYLKSNVLVGPIMGKPFLTLVPKEVGEKEISECKLK